MIAYKAFEPGLICRSYQFVMGLNQTERADCRANGFHCAENPLDCLSYYPDISKSEFCLVKTGGDIDEDGNDTKIACTELTIIRNLTLEEFFLHALAFMVYRPNREWSSHVKKDRTQANCGYAVVRGIDPVARGGLGDILAFAKEDVTGTTISQITLARVDGTKILPDIWYGADLNERQVLAL